MHYDALLRIMELSQVFLEVQGWHSVPKSHISKEQRRKVMTQAVSLEQNKIQAAMFAILGQDYKTTCSQGLWDRDRRHSSRAGSGKAVSPTSQTMWKEPAGKKMRVASNSLGPP